MRWIWTLLPFVGKAVHALELRELELAHRDETIAQLQAERDYWRKRAEQLIDASLARAGAIHEPTMVDRKMPDPRLDPAAMISAALAVTEIDSSKKKGT